MKEKIRKAIGTGCGIILLLGVVAYFALGFLLRHALESVTEPVTNVAMYQQIRNTYWPSNLVAHFPETLPPSAVFHFHPRFLQGGASIQARVTTSQEACASLLANCSLQALVAYQGGDRNDHGSPSNAPPTTSFYTSGSKHQEFPNDFTILVLSAEDYDGGHAWNHGDSTGVAISTQRHEIVYWAESW